MSTVSIPSPTPRPRKSADVVIRNLRRTMRENGVTPAVLVWILGCSWTRAVRLRVGSRTWTCTEVFLLMQQVTPAPVPTIDWSSVFSAEAAA